MKSSIHTERCIIRAASLQCIYGTWTQDLLVVFWSKKVRRYDTSVVCNLQSGPTKSHDLIKRSIDVKGQRFVNRGTWNSIHVVEVQELSKTQALYKLTTTVMLSMDVNRKELGNTNLSGNLTRQTEKTKDIEGDNSTGMVHITNIGKMIEDMEIELRSNMDVLYIGKTREVVNGMRTLSNAPVQKSIFVGELSGAVGRRGQKE